MGSRLAIVTATLDYPRAQDCISSWFTHALEPVDLYVVGQTAGRGDWEVIGRNPGTAYGYKSREILGVVPAFAIGVQRALEDGAQIIAAFHDDLLIEQDGWDEDVVRLFKACPRAGLVGFGGAKGLGSDDLYKSPYAPMQLARQGFRSNMRDAEAHGIRSESVEPVACLDGFSQIGLANFWKGCVQGRPYGSVEAPVHDNLFRQMQDWGVVHHFYDGMLGAFAKQLNYMVWFLPIRCHHFGGRTAVGDSRYHEWALKTSSNTVYDQKGDLTLGDQTFWTQAHQIGYTQFKDVLPIRT